jgi:hypothetical protein
MMVKIKINLLFDDFKKSNFSDIIKYAISLMGKNSFLVISSIIFFWNLSNASSKAFKH